MTQMPQPGPPDESAHPYPQSWPGDPRETAPIPPYPYPVLPGAASYGPPNPFSPNPAAEPGSWTMLDLFSGLGLMLVASTVFALPFQLWDLSPTAALLLAGLAPIWLGILVQTRWSVRRRGSGSWRTDLGLRFRWVDLAIGLGVGIGARIAAGVVTLLTTDVDNPGRGNLDPIVGSLDGVALALVMIFGVSIIGPVVEEIFFRGLLIRSAVDTIRRSRPSWSVPQVNRMSIGLSAVLFLAIHLPEFDDPRSLPAMIITIGGFGAACAALTVATGRLGPAIISHIVFNGVSAVAVLSFLG